MLKKFQKTLSIGLSGLLALGIGVTNAADTTAQRVPNVLHEMVPHVVLPETIQYNKTAKNLPGTGYSGVNSPYVATYVAYPSYQVPYATVFRPIGQSVYPVSPPMLPAPLPQEQPELEPIVEEELAQSELKGRDVVLTQKVSEPIRLAAGAEEVIPVLPMPGSVVTQTGIFCQQPATPPGAWAFSSPIFKVASVPAGWGGQQAGSITHNGPKGTGQHVGFMPAGGAESAEAGMAPQGVPYSTFQMGREQNPGVQAQVLPNGMVLLTMPPDHSGCGLIRCRTGQAPRMMLLPPGPAPMMPGMIPQGIPAPAMQSAMMSGSFGMPYMPVAQQAPMMMPQMQMPPQMQIVPVTAMTPMGPAIIGYQQVPAMNPMAMNPMMNPQMQQVQMAMATPNPIVATQASEETGEETLQSPALLGTQAAANPMAVVATPYGYAIQVPADALQTDAAAQLAQMQQALVQSQMPMQMPMQMNPYAGLSATPYGYAAMNPMAGQFGGMQPMMMNVGYQPAGMMMPGQMGMSSGGMSVSDMLQIMAFLNNNKPQQRRARLADRLAERRENRPATHHNDPFAQLMQAWTTPYTASDMAVRMPASNAYPYGYFGVQASPVSTANYGGYHNLYLGSTAYPGLY
jgi:hypothetical protein